MEWIVKRSSELYVSSSGLSKASDQFGYGFPFLSYKDVFNNYYAPEELSTLVNSTEKDRQTCSVKRGDVFLTRTSETTDELGMSCVALKDYDNATFNGFTKRLRPLTDEIVPEYAAYFFRSAYFRAQCQSLASLITRASLNDGMICRFKIKFPKEKKQQERIGKILLTYDTLIENNTKRIRLLEKMAENLYKEWFVRFRFPGHEKVEIENGLPKGWKVESLGNLLDIRYGKDHKKLGDGDIPIYGSGGIMRYGNTALYDGSSVLIPRKGSLNNIIYVEGKFWTVDTMFYSVPKKDDICFYMFYVLSLVDMTAYNAGAALPSMTTSILNRMKVVLPDRDLLKKFDGILHAYHRQKQNLQHQNTLLAHQRDLLLPRLMSGKLEVKLPKHKPYLNKRLSY